MEDKEGEELRRITFLVEPDLFEQSQKIPFKARSALLRILLKKLMDAADREGPIIYSAVAEGKFELRYTGDDKDV